MRSWSHMASASFRRVFTRYRTICSKWWVEMDSNQRKLSLADLQSAPFSHSGIYPITIPLARGGFLEVVSCFDKVKSHLNMN